MSQETKLNLLSAVMDLKRVATGYQNGSPKMAERFKDEAINRLSKTAITELKPYIRNIIHNLPDELNLGEDSARAETALTYSVIIQNYALASSS
ncbi:MAG TPA: hypothetical protein VMQ44_01290 [Candidatus Saccharimonadales bacterium]|nr:hypothetical protein [Candidatus Saccharimonadales bacterium]